MTNTIFVIWYVILDVLKCDVLFLTAFFYSKHLIISTDSVAKK